MNVCDAIVSVPLRADPEAFAATENDTVPPPFPLAPFVTVIQLALLVADHAHPASDDTSVDPVPPPAGTEPLAAESAYVQAMPGCVTLKL